VRVLLDTHVVVSAVAQGIDHFPNDVRRLLEAPNTERIISTVSVTEIAVKAAIGKLDFGAVVIGEAIADMKLNILPYLPKHALRLFDLPLHHRDPFDRMLISTALVEGLPVVSRDRHFQVYEGLQVIW
jgi:PIN domain nuclease of toxin-antitoxin system